MKYLLILILQIFLNNITFVNAIVAKGDFYGAKTVEMPKWFKNAFLDLSDDIDEATENNKFIIIYFHQNGCPYCAKLIKDNFQNEQLVKKIRKNFEVIEINMFGDKELTDWNGQEFNEKSFAQYLKIQFTPSLIFMNQNKKIVLRLNGYQSTKKMHVVLDYMIGKHYEKLSFADYKNQQNNNQSTTKLNNKNFFTQKLFDLTRNKDNSAEKYLAVFFEQSNCAQCDIFHQTILNNKQTINYFKKMQVVQFNSLSNQQIITPNGKKTTMKNWYKELDLTYNPAIVFFDKNGREIIRKDAFFKTFHSQAILTYVLDKAYQNQPSFQRYIEHKSLEIRKQGNDVDIWK